MRHSLWRKHGVAVGVTVGLLMGSCAVGAQLPARPIAVEAQRSYDAGLERYSAREYQAALPHLQHALALAPAFNEAESHLAWSYYYLGEYVQAARHFRQAILRQPKWEGLYNGLGWTRYRVGRYHIAVGAFQQALSLDPDYRDARIGLAFSLFEQGEYAQALPSFARLTREGEGGFFRAAAADVEEVRGRYAWTLYYLGQLEQARRQFEKGLGVHPEWYGLHNGLGWTSLRLGDRARARRHFERALALRPDFRDAQEGLQTLDR
jgi:tetratricopeptide (TPR) repeat protein